MSPLQFVNFESTDHLQLPGLLYEPDTKTNRVMLYLHGNGSGGAFYSPQKMNTLGKALNEKGIAFFPFNNRGANYSIRLKRKRGDEEERVLYGTSYELIKECIMDIDGAIDFLSGLGYTTFYLAGISTGANKIVVYHYYKQKNRVSKYVLLSGGDDTGLYFEEMGRKKFENALQRAKDEVAKGNGDKMIPHYITAYPLSWKSLLDTINPDGDYNSFPFNEYMNNLHLSKGQLFTQYKTINKPTLVIYGGMDEYCYGNVKKCIEILKKECPDKSKFTFEIIEGADHGFSGDDEEVGKRITRWI